MSRKLRHPEGQDGLCTNIGFPNWNKEFHVHVDASSTMLGIVLAQPGEGTLDHPIAYASRKLSFTERNYTTTEKEGLVMVYALQKFRHYLLG